MSEHPQQNAWWQFWSPTGVLSWTIFCVVAVVGLVAVMALFSLITGFNFDGGS